MAINNILAKYLYVDYLVTSFIICNMDTVRVRDFKKALRLCGWVFVMVVGNSTCYRHPSVPYIFTIHGKDCDIISPTHLRILERQLGLCLGKVLG